MTSVDVGKQDDVALDDSLDLYGDLSVDLSQEMPYLELKKSYEESQAKNQELMKENKYLKDQNLVLKKNISSLYLTAREEIQRKDTQIKTLQEKEVKKKFKWAQSSKDT